MKYGQYYAERCPTLVHLALEPTWLLSAFLYYSLKILDLHLTIFSVIPVGTFGYDDFTIDWYEVFMAWGLDLAELKQLAMNSILSSSMSEGEKQVNCLKTQH